MNINYLDVLSILSIFDNINRYLSNQDQRNFAWSHPIFYHYNQYQLDIKLSSLENYQNILLLSEKKKIEWPCYYLFYVHPIDRLSLFHETDLCSCTLPIEIELSYTICLLKRIFGYEIMIEYDEDSE